MLKSRTVCVVLAERTQGITEKATLALGTDRPGFNRLARQCVGVHS